MGNIIKFTSLVINKNYEKKVSVPDENGYYELTLGGLNVYNSSGCYYPLDSAKALFEASSALMRRINRGQLRSELGHPKKMPGMSMREYIQRAVQIFEDRVCAHIKEVWLDYDAAKNDPGLDANSVLIKGLVKPSGPHGNTLAESIKNQMKTQHFSIRSLTHDKWVGGKLEKNIKEIITWDYVNEPGIAKANQWSDLGMESLYENIIDVTTLELVVEEEMYSSNESDRNIAKEILDIIKEIKRIDTKYGVHTKW